MSIIGTPLWRNMTFEEKERIAWIEGKDSCDYDEMERQVDFAREDGYERGHNRGYQYGLKLGMLRR